MSIRIVHWYENFLRGGGVANAVLGLANAQVRTGHEVYVVAREWRGPALYGRLEPSLEAQLYRWQGCQLPSFGLVVPPRGLGRSLRDLRPDVVHIHGEFNPNNLWARRLVNATTVLTPHGALHPVLQRKGSRSRTFARRLYVQAASQALYRRVTLIHGLSPMEQRHIAPLACPTPVYVVPQGASVQALTALEQAAPESSGHDLVLLYAGRLDVHTKGLDVLLHALARVPSTVAGRSVSLWLIGPDWRGGAKWLRRLARQLGVTDRVRFVGPCTGPELVAYMRQATIFVLVSRHEGFPLSLTEALLAGLPAIVSREVGTVSYADVTGWPHVRTVAPEVEPTAEALREVLEQAPELQAAARCMSPAVDAFFDWRRIAADHVTRISEALPSANPDLSLRM